MATDLVPPFVFVINSGVIESRTVAPAQKEQLMFNFDVITRQPIGQRLQPLNQYDIASLLDWDAEKYRSELNEAKDF
jgi:hypothetical protein